MGRTPWDCADAGGVQNLDCQSVAAAEQDCADEAFRGCLRIVGVDRKSDGAGRICVTAINEAEVFSTVPPFGEPLSELRCPGPHDEECDGSGLLTFLNGPRRQRRIPHVPNQLRANECWCAEPHDEHVRRRVGRRSFAQVAAEGLVCPPSLRDAAMIKGMPQPAFHGGELYPFRSKRGDASTCGKDHCQSAADDTAARRCDVADGLELSPLTRLFACPSD